MENLLKKYDFILPSDYFDMIINTKFNGNITQAKELFYELDKDKKYFLIYLNQLEILPKDKILLLNFFLFLL